MGYFLLFVVAAVAVLIAIDKILHRTGLHEKWFGQCLATYLVDGKRRYHNWEFLGRNHRHCLVCNDVEHYIPTYGGIAGDGEPWYRWINERDL